VDDTVELVAKRPGLLLTGGASRRMGGDKASLVLAGERLVDRAARVLAVVCDPVLEVGPGLSNLPAVSEDPPGDGPLAALVAGARALEQRPERAVLALAVDLPFVEPALLELIANRPGDATVVPIAGGHPQTACAQYGVDALRAAPALLAAGERSLRALLAAVPVVWVAESEWSPVATERAFTDIDTPEDRARYGIEMPSPPERHDRPG
jgi:molybdenum cofactor guanylyltransferase